MRGLSGSALKCIAILTMLVDHIGAAVFARLLLAGEGSAFLYSAYTVSRTIGRIAFPIFCFLLVEGFVHTHNRSKYAVRLFVFAALSEIPFDLAFSGSVLEFSHQNVFLTLGIGFLTMWGFWAVEQKGRWNPVLRKGLQAVILCTGMAAAYILRTDYDMLGVLCIMALYVFRGMRGPQILAGCLAFGFWEPAALVAFLPLAFYNGTRGWNIKYVFYAFYPFHLLVLYVVCACMGIAGISVL